MKRIGVDVGGTFTDLILVDEEEGRITVDKVPSTPDDPSRSVVEGVRALCAKAGVALADVDNLLHGTTVATNIALTHSGARGRDDHDATASATSSTSPGTRSRSTSRSSRSCPGSRGRSSSGATG